MPLQLHQPGAASSTGISQVKDLRWRMLRKNQAESVTLPPTQGAVMKQFSAPPIKRYFGTMIKCVVLVCHSQVDSEGRKGRINGSPL